MFECVDIRGVGNTHPFKSLANAFSIAKEVGRKGAGKRNRKSPVRRGGSGWVMLQLPAYIEHYFGISSVNEDLPV